MFFQVLKDCGALQIVFPEIHALVGVDQVPQHHPEGCAFTHTMLVLDCAARLTTNLDVRIAALLHDLGKAVSAVNPENGPGQHKDHEKAGVPLIRAMAVRLKGFPSTTRDFACLVAEHHLIHHRALDLRSGRVVKLLNLLKVRHSLDTLEKFLLACEADARGRGGDASKAPMLQGAFLLAAAVAARQVRPRPGLSGPKVGDLLFQDMAEAVARVRKNF